MEYNLNEFFSDLRNSIRKKQEIGLFENQFATYYSIPIFAKNSLVTIVINKKSGDKFFYCNGKKIEPDLHQSSQLQHITKTAIDDEIKQLKQLVASDVIKTIQPKSAVFLYYLRELSPVISLAYGTNYKKLDITCKNGKDIKIVPNEWLGHLINIQNNPHSVMYVINEFETQKEYMLTHNKLSGQYHLVCDNAVDNKYFYYKMESIMRRVNSERPTKTTTYEQILTDVFNKVEQEYKSRHL